MATTTRPDMGVLMNLRTSEVALNPEIIFATERCWSDGVTADGKRTARISYAITAQEDSGFVSLCIRGEDGALLLEYNGCDDDQLLTPEELRNLPTQLRALADAADAVVMKVGDEWPAARKRIDSFRAWTTALRPL